MPHCTVAARLIAVLLLIAVGILAATLFRSRQGGADAADRQLVVLR